MKLLRYIGLIKRFIWVVYSILWENPNKLLSQHNSKFFQIITVQFSSVISNSLQSYELQCHPTISSSVIPLSIFPIIRVISNESILHIRWPKYWGFSFSISRSNEYLGLIPFKIDWLDLLAVLGTLKSLFQHHSLKASSIRCSTFFMVQQSHSYMTTGKTIPLSRWTFIGKIMLS